MPLLQWLPGETLYSWIARQHTLWGHRLPAQTAKALFGHDRRGYQHDFPGHLAELVVRTDGQVGDVRSIGLDRTLLRFYRPFLSEASELAYAAAMGGATVAHVRRRLTWARRGGLQVHHPLKACATCIQEDREVSGWAYWHMDHQYPGVWICPVHSQPLQVTSSRSNRYDRVEWNVPDVESLEPAPLADVGVRELESCSRIAWLICDVVGGMPLSRVAPAELNVFYRAALYEQGFVAAAGPDSRVIAAQELVRHLRPLRALPELRGLTSNVEQMNIQLARLLAPTGQESHPMMHFVMMDWLRAARAGTKLLRRVGWGA
ncbi:UNVERIFIED_ORG: TniQ family protein [Shinella sp. XGS7]